MSARKKFIHVCLTPALIDQFDVSDAIVVVIDVLRATTTMCVAFDHGVQLMVPVEHIDECQQYRDQGFLIAGERSGEQLADFDLGNSPFAYAKDVVSGKKIAITTTNGTRAIKAAQERGAKEVVVGSFSNIGILCDWLISQNQHVCLICSGWKDHPNLEDTIFAGAVARKLRNHFYRFQDTTIMAEAVFQSANRRKRYFMRNSSHFNRLIHLNLQKEVKYALHRDTHPVLPIMVNHELHDISKHLEDYKAYTETIRISQETEQKKAVKS
ncbi:MAG: 2-phosphosulfolactate phosphatase [Bacteroidetes bacterium]|jgi:2-phosphosulfolactate phosphatase|nr:MAG: 2-phosphosulfolactate phosphatase [Bacteroidota bacterium]